MTIKTKTSRAPWSFPPARLFLDDIKEIAGILRELLEAAYAEKDQEVARITYLIGKQECDDVCDLPKIARRTRDMEIEIRKGWQSVSLSFIPWSGSYFSSRLSEEDEWSAYHRLEPIFKKRKLPLRWVLHALPDWCVLTVMATVGGASVALLGIAAKSRSLAAFGAALLSLVILIAIVLAGKRHTTVILRDSWEPSPLGAYLKDKIVPMVFGAMLGIGGTLFEMYLKHRYWP